MAIDWNNNSLRYSKIEISSAAISELDGDRLVITIPREQIRQIKLCYDTDVRNPFCQYFLGFSLVSLGLLGLVVTFFASTGSAPLVLKDSGDFVLPLVPLSLWLMIGVGAWLLMRIFRARYHLWIKTENGTHRIFFDRAADVQEIRGFLRQAHLNFGYSIDMAISDNTHPSS